MRNRKRLFFTLFSLLLLVLVYNFGFTPLSGSNETLNQEVNELKSELSTLREATGGDDQTTELGELELKNVEVAIPDYFDQDELIKQLSQLSGNYSLQLDSLSFTRKNTENQYIDGVQISLSMKGGLFNFIDFLRSLENQQRFYNLKDVSLSISKDEPKQVNFNATLIVYHS